MTGRADHTGGLENPPSVAEDADATEGGHSCPPQTRGSGGSQDPPSAAADALIEDLLGQMVEQQRAKLQRLARRLAPDASRDDLLNPQDVRALSRDPVFNYEDGVLAGLLSAQIALRRETRGGGH